MRASTSSSGAAARSATRRPARDEIEEIVARRRDGRLLQHDFAEPDAIGIGPLPRRGAPPAITRQGSVRACLSYQSSRASAEKAGSVFFVSAALRHDRDVSGRRRALARGGTHLSPSRTAQWRDKKTRRTETAQPLRRPRRGGQCRARSGLPQARLCQSRPVRPLDRDRAAALSTRPPCPNGCSGRAARRARKGRSSSSDAPPGAALAVSHEGERIARAVNTYFGYFLVRDIKLSAEPFVPPAPDEAPAAECPPEVKSAKSAQMVDTGRRRRACARPCAASAKTSRSRRK